MTLTELRYIIAVGREHHFGRAAAACFVSQPTLSTAVKKLEDELGVSIFERSKSDVSVTGIGKKIIEQAQQVLENAETIKHIAAQGKDQLNGAIRIGVIYTIGPYLLPHIIQLMHESAPNMPLIINEDYTAKLTDKLKNGILDAIIISLPFQEAGISTISVYDEPFVVLLSCSHPLSQKSVIKLSMLAKENLLLLGQDHCFREQVLTACPECSDTLRRKGSLQETIEGSSLETIRYMVASGIGVTVLPCTAASADRYAQRLVKIVRLAKPPPSRRVAIAWRSSFPRPQAIEALRQAILSSQLSCVNYILSSD